MEFTSALLFCQYIQGGNNFFAKCRIEHMQEWDLPALVNCVFHRIRPKLVIITTPNADFNKHIPKFTPGTFRHWDHKFEWTSKEFQIWWVDVLIKCLLQIYI